MSNLSTYIYTNFEAADAALAQYAQQLETLPLAERVAYHRAAAFLHNQRQQYEQALLQLDRASAHLDIGNQPFVAAELLAFRAAVLLNQRQWGAAQTAIDQAQKLAGNTAPAALKAHIACRQGFLNLHLNRRRQAMDALLEAEKLLFELEDRAGLQEYYFQTLVYSALGELYAKLGEQDKSLEAYHKILPIVEAHGLRPRVAWHFLNAGRAAIARQDTEQARQYFEAAQRYVTDEDAHVLTHILGNLGILDLMEGRFDSAMARFEQAAAQYGKPQTAADYINLSKIDTWRAGAYFNEGRLAEAEARLLDAWENDQRGDDRYNSFQVSDTLALVYAEMQRYEDAWNWQRRAQSLQRAHYEALYDRERQEIEALHELERSRQEAQMARLRVSGLQLRALRAQMNPHFMFNALNAIQGLIRSNENRAATGYLAKFAQLMRQTLEYTDKEEIAMDEEIEFLEQYLDINRLRFQDEFSYEINQPRGLEDEDWRIPTMILQPFVENAVEHGIRPRHKGHIQIHFELIADDTLLRCTIEDDGIGINASRAQKQQEDPASATHRSKGMEITRERLQLLHQIYNPTHRSGAEYLWLEDREPQASGTRVTVVLPIILL
jgi:two-component system, LytTR family, sensor kinase